MYKIFSSVSVYLLRCFSHLITFFFGICLHQSFVEKQRFFENYEMLFQSLKLSAEAYVSADSSGE